MYRIALPFFALLLFACNKSIPVSQSAGVSFKQCYESNTKNDNYSLCLDSIISDSRCPRNAECIWGGIALAKFRFAANNRIHSFVLATESSAPNSADTTLEGYKIHFVNLYPYPGDPPSEVKAEVTVTR